jgi:hypothetical protein
VTYAQVSVYTLDQCAQGTTAINIGSDPSNVTLESTECRQLLTLDPFYVNGQHFLSQNAPPNNNSPWGSYMEGNTGYGIGNIQPQIISVEGSGYQGQVGTSISTMITAMTGNTSSFGFNLNALGLQIGYNDTITNTTTTQNTNSSGTNLQTATNNQVSQTAQAKLVAPVQGQPVATWLFVDNRYGTIMFPAYSPAANQLCHYTAPAGGGAAGATGNQGASASPTPVTGTNCVAINPAGPAIPWQANTVMVINGFGFTDTTGVYFSYPKSGPVHLPGEEPYLQKAVFSLNSDDQIDVTAPALPNLPTNQPHLVIEGMGFAPYDIGPIQLTP